MSWCYNKQEWVQIILKVFQLLKYFNSLKLYIPHDMNCLSCYIICKTLIHVSLGIKITLLNEHHISTIK